MEARYVAVYRIRDGNSLADGDPAPLLSVRNPALTATLTTDPEAHFEHIDRAAAIGSQLLKGLFGQAKEGTMEERLTAEIDAVRAERTKKMGTGVYAVFEGSSDTPDPEFKIQRDADAFAVSLDDIPKNDLRDIFAPKVRRILTALALSLPDNADRRVEQVGAIVYLVEAGKPVYLYNPQMGTPGISIASPVRSDAIAEASALASGLEDEANLDRAVRLLLSSLDAGADDFPAFIAAWSALENLHQRIL